VILLALAATSPLAVVRRLGGKRWQRLHRLIYPAAALILLHFAWAQKKDLRPMLPFAGAMVGVIVLRLAARARGRRPSARPPV
ncbi:MAG TPA: sulfoxide reductase heme-binding subunit YedZ, partial [Gemmatimonadales bacterium]